MNQDPRDPKRRVASGTQRRWLRGAGLLLLLAAIAWAAYVAFHDRPSPPPTATAAQPDATNAVAAAVPAAAPANFEKLKGQWLRPDGGYVLEVKYIEANGTATAGYLNPRPIRVARAQAQQDAGATKLFIELRDTGYPGCTYNLTYHPDRDELEGVYFQAAMGAYYDVVFTRMK